jgi:hypothetical protein
MKMSKEEIRNVISKLKTAASSCEHQAICIEANDSDEPLKTSDGTVVAGLQDMWDSNDSDNWTSMEANILDGISALEKILQE